MSISQLESVPQMVLHTLMLHAVLPVSTFPALKFFMGGIYVLN